MSPACLLELFSPGQGQKPDHLEGNQQPTDRNWVHLSPLSPDIVPQPPSAWSIGVTRRLSGCN